MMHGIIGDCVFTFVKDGESDARVETGDSPSDMERSLRPDAWRRAPLTLCRRLRRFWLHASADAPQFHKNQRQERTKKTAKHNGENAVHIGGLPSRVRQPAHSEVIGPTGTAPSLRI